MRSTSRGILRLLGDDALRRRMGQAALEVARAELVTWDERMELEMTEILELLGSG